MEKNPAGIQFNTLLYSAVAILKYKKRTIYNVIYIKVFSSVTVSYITVSTDDVLNTANNETVFTELRIVFE